jgi:T5SS/PEP-CTERM-associated repeat protein
MLWRFILSFVLCLAANHLAQGQNPFDPFEKRPDEDPIEAQSAEIRRLATETRALRQAVEKLDEKVQRLSTRPTARAAERRQPTVSRDRELLNAGTVTAKEYRVICQQAGVIGQLIVRSGSKVDLDERLAVGQKGAGILKVLEGGALANLVRADIGEQLGSYGSVVVAGRGSQWITPMGVEIGSRGHGRLEITDGGFFSNGARADIGNSPGATGEVRVIGKNSRWITESGIEVGPFGAGVLLVADGGQVKNGARFDVGAHDNGNGQVFVVGPNSSWTCSGGGTVGARGTGSIMVQAGGRVSAVSFDVGPHGSIGGDGTIQGNIQNAGQIRPSGTLIVEGHLLQKAAGTLLIQASEIGDGLSKVRIAGTASLSGTLDLTHCDRPTTKARQITLLTAEKIENEFNDVRLPSSQQSRTWHVKYTPRAVILEADDADDEAANASASP